MLHVDIILISVGAAIIITALLGLLVFFANPKSVSNRAFFGFSVSAIGWNVFNYLSYQQGLPIDQLVLVRFVLFFAVIYCFSIFTFFFLYPKDEAVIPNWYTFGVVPVILAVLYLVQTPYIFHEIGYPSPQITQGPLFFVFAATVISLIVAALFIIIKKTIQASDNYRKPLKIIVAGTALTFSLHIIFNLILVGILEKTQYTQLGALFSLPVILFTSYAIIKYHFLNIKTIVTQLIVYLLWIFVFIRTVLSTNTTELEINGVLLLVLVFIGIFLVRSVKKEVFQRERLQKLTVQLEEANDKLKDVDKRKTEFLSLASHQLRSPITAIKGYTSMVLEGSYGKLDEKQTEPISRVFQSSLNLANVVEDLLDIAKIEQGGMKYEFKDTDLEQITSGLAKEFALTAKSKGLELTYENTGAVPCMVSMDPSKFRQVILNLVDNSIKYTEKGFVKLSLKKEMTSAGGTGVAKIEISDSGMGMSPETKEKLFGKFSRGEGAKVNAGGSGIGLYLAKQIAEAHKGTVTADSEGLGKGSTFTITIPLLKE